MDEDHFTSPVEQADRHNVRCLICICHGLRNRCLFARSLRIELVFYSKLHISTDGKKVAVAVVGCVDVGDYIRNTCFGTSLG